MRAVLKAIKVGEDSDTDPEAPPDRLELGRIREKLHFDVGSFLAVS